MVFSLLIIGIISSSIVFYMLGNTKLTIYQYYLAEFLGIGFIILGVGLGMSIARYWKIQNID
jgi:hypothetical protein